jgi:cysteine desulfurase/selenocysteine lyase
MLTERSRRQDFPSLEGRTYLNTAAEGIPPVAVGEALAEYFRDRQLGAEGRPRHDARWREARELAGRLFGLTASEVGFCSCSSEAFNLAALALRLRPGDEVVINDLDFPSGSTPWLLPECPAQVRVWRSQDFALRIEDLVPLLGPKTRLVTASLVSYWNGYRLPLPATVDAVRSHSPALLALDVTQAVGRIPLDLSGVDLIVSSTHKWICGTHGGGLVGVPSARAAELKVPAGGWFNLVRPFERAPEEPVETKRGTESFMVGMPNFPAVYGVRAAMEYNLSVGVEAIDRSARPLVHACRNGLARLPVELITPGDDEALAGIVAFRHPRMAELQPRLQAERVHVMHSSGRMRVSLHGYNTLADVERFLQVLTEAVRDV